MPVHGEEEEGEHQHYHGVDKVEEHISVDEALSKLLAGVVAVKSESVRSSDSFRRVLYQDVSCLVDVPAKARSTRDGYALCLSNVNDSQFKVVGDIRIGTVPNILLKPSEAARVATGSYLPKGANSVVMIEYVNKIDDYRIEIEREAKIGENILAKGEDLKKGSVILRRGLRVSAQHVALLAQIRKEKVTVFQKPTVSFFSTGDELFDPFTHRGKISSTGIPDINRHFIRSMVEDLNATPIDLGIAKDNYEEIKKRIQSGLESSDGLILSAGSSVGERDYALKAAKSIRGVSVLLHGVAMRPSSPTGLALYKGKPFILLPGFPTSAFMSFFVFARAAILKISGEEGSGKLQPVIRAQMLDEYLGRKGIKHFLRVKVTPREDGSYVASIVKPTEAYFSSWLGKANGIAILDENHTEIRPGDEASVFLIAL